MIWFILGFVIGKVLGILIGCCMNISGTESRLEELRDAKYASEDFLKEMSTKDLENIFHEK